MAKVRMKTYQSLNNFQSFWNIETFDADWDETEMIDVADYRVLGIAIQNLTSGDEIIVEWVLAYEVSTWAIIWTYVQVLDSSDTNPFTADWLNVVDVSPYAKIRIRKTGSNWTWVTLQASTWTYS